MNIFKNNRKMLNIFSRNYIWYIILIIFVIVSCMYYDREVENCVKSGTISQIKASLSDYYINIFSGAAIINKYGKRDYDIPFMWFSIQLVVCAITSLKPYYYSSYKDVYALIKSKKRTNYIIKQIFDTFIKIVLVYIVIMITIVLYSSSKGYISTEIHYELFQNINSYMGINIGMYIYPLLYSVMMAILQVYLNMYINRIIVIAFIVAYNILAIYIPIWYILGNMSMIYRSINSAIKVEYSVIACCLLIMIFIILVVFKFQKYDVVSMEER